MLKRLQTILQPSSEACRLAGRLTMCMIVLIGIRNILWPKKPPKGGNTIKKRLSSFLSTQLILAPTRGPGTYLRRFVEHAEKVTKSYWPGLFHCYDDPRIPQTSNSVEGIFGKGKRLLRACGGRKSTAVGPGSTGGSFFLFAVAFHEVAPREEREALLMQYSKQEYKAARIRQREIRGPEARRRQYARNPESLLDSIGKRWEERRV